jgi:Flp pilus assembly CpaE family ATPase
VHPGQLSLAKDSLGSAVGLGFSSRGGPLVAVAGMCGGAGATTLAYLAAAAAAIESTGPVLLADLGGPSAGIATYARVQSAQSFTSLAGSLGRGEPPHGSPAVTGEYGLQVLATGPELDQPVPDGSAAQLLDQAAAAHALTVLDCGGLTRAVERVGLELATHVVWVLPATTAGVRRAAALLGTMGKYAPAREIVVARHDQGNGRPPITALAALADARHAPLVLVPHLDDLVEASTEVVLEQAALALQALGGVLHR